MFNPIKILFAVVMVYFCIGCTTTKKCSDISDEPVSPCRAQQACGQGTARMYFAFILGGIGSGLTGQPNAVVDNYNKCVDSDLNNQKLNQTISTNMK
jgi:hypothetical protein